MVGIIHMRDIKTGGSQLLGVQDVVDTHSYPVFDKRVPELTVGRLQKCIAHTALQDAIGV